MEAGWVVSERVRIGLKKRTFAEYHEWKDGRWSTVLEGGFWIRDRLSARICLQVVSQSLPKTRSEARSYETHREAGVIATIIGGNM